MLCEKCEYIRLPHTQPPRKRHSRSHLPHGCIIKHHANLDDLIAAAEAGCEVCQFFRPFAEYGKLRRRGRAQRSASDCSSSLSIGYDQEDPFGALERDWSDSSEDGLRDRSGEDAQRYYIAPGKYYLEDSDHERYFYDEEDEVGTGKSLKAQEAAVTADEEAYQNEYRERLARLGLVPDENVQEETNASARASESSHANDLRYLQRMSVKLNTKYQNLQWVLTTTDRSLDRDQLWITLKHCESVSAFNHSSADKITMLVLTAGSIDRRDFDEVGSICVNGVQGYTRYSLAALYPGIWKYRDDQLIMPQKRPARNLRPVLEFYQNRDETFVTEPRVQGREVHTNPASEPVMGLARSWLESCKEHDELCKLNGHVSMPSRLIDVGLGPDDAHVKIHEVAANEEGIRYATLSHCWGSGSEMISRTLRHNLSARLEGLGVAELPQNFRDAIRVTRGVGLRYLWIDALCIIQDSEEDWAAEAANMSDYYRGSELTISALAAQNANQGFLHDRSVLSPPLKIVTEGGNLYLRPLLSDIVTITDDLDQSNYRGRVVAQPINQRAWTLQERLFSRRILYFTQEQMVWHCRSRFFGEDGQYAFNQKGVTARAESDIVDILNYQERLIGDEQKPSAPTVRSTGWYTLVKAFTQRQLTYDRDRLPALSGLAREINRVTENRYVAGLWFKNDYYLKVGLLWQVCSDAWARTPRAPKRASNTFPSWSWASLDAEIEHPSVDHSVVRLPDLDPKLVTIKAPPTSSDPFGAVRWGRLVIEAWHHRYQGLRSHRELFQDALVHEPSPEWTELSTKDFDSPKDDPLVNFDLEVPNDLWQADGWWSHCCYSLVLICYADDFSDDERLKTKYASQHFLLLKAQVIKGLPVGWKRVGIGATEEGTLLRIDEEHGWERQKIYIH